MAVGNLNVGLGVVHRSAKAAQTSIAHDELTEIYHVLAGSGTLVTGGTMDGKTDARYSGYPGSLRMRTVREELARDATFHVYNAVRGMLQRNSLGAKPRDEVVGNAQHESAKPHTGGCPEVGSCAASVLSAAWSAALARCA